MCQDHRKLNIFRSNDPVVFTAAVSLQTTASTTTTKKKRGSKEAPSVRHHHGAFLEFDYLVFFHTHWWIAAGSRHSILACGITSGVYRATLPPQTSTAIDRRWRVQHWCVGLCWKQWRGMLEAQCSVVCRNRSVRAHPSKTHKPVRGVGLGWGGWCEMALMRSGAGGMTLAVQDHYWWLGCEVNFVTMRKYSAIHF